jgi:hypothetical protein
MDAAWLCRIHPRRRQSAETTRRMVVVESIGYGRRSPAIGLPGGFEFSGTDYEFPRTGFLAI